MSGSGTWPLVLNLGNSIIGVAVLAMPFCFKQCGIILGIVLLLFCTWLTLVSCQLLMKAAVVSRKRSYEYLAYYTFGAPGKFVIEIGMIGLQIGTLIAQIVVIGDLGPGIVSKVFGVENTSNLRTGLIVFLCLCVGLPLGLLKDLRSVSRASTLCICFYTVFVFYLSSCMFEVLHVLLFPGVISLRASFMVRPVVFRGSLLETCRHLPNSTHILLLVWMPDVMFLSIPNLWTGDWYPKVAFWRPEGLFQTLPIFSLSFGCQTQLFLLYDSLPEPTLKSINSVISSAVNLCAVAYLLVGFFGYIAFYEQDVGGDIITLFPSTFAADMMKLFFVVSIAVTFPLIIFPCRASLYTLLFPHKHKAYEDLQEEGHMPELHFQFITVSIVISSMIIGILVPNVEFILGMNGATMGTLICYIFPALFFVQVVANKAEGRHIARLVMVLGITILLVSTFATLYSQDKAHTHPIKLEETIGKKDVPLLNKPPELPIAVAVDKKGEKRVEPPVPDAPLDSIEVKKNIEKKIEDLPKKDGLDEAKVPDKDKEKSKDGEKEEREVKEEEGKKEGENVGGKVEEANKEKEGEKIEVVEKEENLKEREKKIEENEQKQQVLLDKLVEQQEEQKQLINEQKELLKELKEHKEKDHDEKDEAEAPAQVLQPVQVVQGVQGVQQQPVQGVQQQPVQGVQQQPVQVAQQPVQGVQGIQQQQIQGGQLPVQGVQQPLQGVQQPVQGVQQPLQGVQQPVQGVQQPVQGVQQPVQGVQQPVQGIQQQPVQGGQLPVQQQAQGFQQPLQGIQQPVQGGQLPVQGVQQQVLQPIVNQQAQVQPPAGNLGQQRLQQPVQGQQVQQGQLLQNQQVAQQPVLQNVNQGLNQQQAVKQLNNQPIQGLKKPLDINLNVNKKSVKDVGGVKQAADGVGLKRQKRELSDVDNVLKEVEGVGGHLHKRATLDKNIADRASLNQGSRRR